MQSRTIFTPEQLERMEEEFHRWWKKYLKKGASWTWLNVFNPIYIDSGTIKSRYICLISCAPKKAKGAGKDIFTSLFGLFWCTGNKATIPWLDWTRMGDFKFEEKTYIPLVSPRQQYMVGPERLYLASRLNLTEAQVEILTVLLLAAKACRVERLFGAKVKLVNCCQTCSVKLSSFH